MPLATCELKNHFTGQTVHDAIKQYRQDRDPRELLFAFKKRALVHFAVDSDEVYFTTKLDGDKTRFFPFNRGNNYGAGKPKKGITWNLQPSQTTFEDEHSWVHKKVCESAFTGSDK